jgi:multidrug resistance efflux pump
MSLLLTIRRTISRGFERLSARPLGMLMFVASVALLVSLHSSQIGRIRARAVAQARGIEHPASVDTLVSAVYVALGDRVEPGAPLAELSAHFIDRELAQLANEIDELIRESKLASARLAVREERWLEEGLRRRPSRPSLLRPTEAVYAAQLERLRTRRSQLLEDRNKLVVKSTASGRVAFVVSPGGAVVIGTSIATVIPEYAEEIVAYVPADTDPVWISPGTEARLEISQLAACRGVATVKRRGAGVVQGPGQLDGFLRRPVYGMPVYISVPEGCELGVGQVLAVEFPKIAH